MLRQLRMRTEAVLGKTAPYFATACCALIFSVWGLAFVEAKMSEMRVAEQRAAEARQRVAFEEQEITCLTNAVFHEVRGESVGVRELVAKTVLAAVIDPTFPRRTVCADAESPGRFSGLKHPRQPHFGNTTWAGIWWHMNQVYYGPRTLPRGWQCVRSFRASDEYLEKLGDRAIRQLGITVTASGMKYFAKSNVPVGTHGTVTFYSPRGGCSHPSPTT